MMMLYVHRDRTDCWDWEPRTATSTFTQLLSSEVSSEQQYTHIHIHTHTHTRTRTHARTGTHAHHQVTVLKERTLSTRQRYTDSRTWLPTPQLPQQVQALLCFLVHVDYVITKTEFCVNNCTQVLKTRHYFHRLLINCYWNK